MSKLKPLWVLLVVLIVSIAWLYRPYPSIDSSQVAPEIRALSQPYREVVVSYFLDGGTLGVAITDSGGEELLCSIAAPDYDKLYLGAMHFSEKGAVSVADPEDSILQVLEIVRGHHEPMHQNDLAIAGVTKRVRDYARVIWRRLTGQYGY